MDRFGETFREAVRAIEVMRERGREEIEQLKRELDGALRREGEALYKNAAQRTTIDEYRAALLAAEGREKLLKERLAAAEQAANLNLAALADHLRRFIGERLPEAPEADPGGPLRLILRDSLGGKESAADVLKAGDDDTPVLIVEEVDGEEIEWLRRLVRAYNVLRGHDEAGDAKLDAAPREAAERCSARAAERAAGRIARILRADGGESFRPMIASVIVDEIRRMYEPEGTPSEEQAEEAATGPRDGSAAFVAMPTTEVEDRWIVGNRDLERLYGVADLTDAQKAIIREIARCGALHPFMQHRGVTMTCTLGNRHEGPHVFEPEDGGAFTAWRREVAP